jgi:adenylate cyclase
MRGLRFRSVVSAGIALSIFATVVVVRQAGGLQGLEVGTYDWMLRLQPRLVLDDNPIVLIKLRELEIQRYGHPLCDARLALALAKLLAAEPRGIGVDIYRDIPIETCGGQVGNNALPNTDTDLADVATRTDRVVMLTKPLEDPPIPPPAFLEGTNQIAVPDFPIDGNGIVHRGLLLTFVEDDMYFSLGLQLAIRYLAEEGIELVGDEEHPEWMRLGETTIPPFAADDGGYVGADDAGYQFMMDYAVGHEGFPSFALEALFRDEIPADALRGKIVLLGTESQTVKDEFFTPLSAGLENPLLLGVEAHGHLVSQLIRFAHGEAQPLRSWTERQEIAWIFAWCVFGAVLGLWNRSGWVSALIAIAGYGGLTLFAYQQLTQSLWLPYVPTAAGSIATAGLVTAYRAMAERAERSAVTDLFSRFLRPEVADLIWEKRDEFIGPDSRPKAQKITLTALMSDLQGYTTASEAMDPADLMAWVNEYMNTMANLVGEYGGVVDDYAGDGIKANFGFPIPSVTDEEIRSDARNAVDCALAMGRAMDALNDSWRVRQMPTGRVRVGIYTGEAVVGILGGGKSLKYTTVGDTVNTAARLESFAKDEFSSGGETSDWRVLIGDGTMGWLDDGFLTQDIGSHALKGKHEEIRIYRVLGASDSGPPPST